MRKEIGAFATPDMIQWTAYLPKTRSGKIMRRILRKIAANDLSNLGDTTTLADPTVVDKLVAGQDGSHVSCISIRDCSAVRISIRTEDADRHDRESEFKPGCLVAQPARTDHRPQHPLSPVAKVDLTRERVELPDGDFIDVEWTSRTAGPIVIVLHGLEGSIRSRYACNIMQKIHSLGMRGAMFPYFRGCSGEPNRLPVSYHSGFTQDLEYFSGLLKQREPNTPLAAVGYSLGGNVLLKWLGESPNAARLSTAVAVSVPFDLAVCSAAIEKGLSQVYMWELMGRMRCSVQRKFARIPSPIPLPDIDRLRTFRQYDDALTAPLHGYKDADDYYKRCSSRR